MSDRQKRERKREIITAHCAAPADPKSLRHVSRENLRTNDHGKHRCNDRSPQNGKQTRAAVFDLRSVLGATAAADLKHFGARHPFRVRQVGLRHQRPSQRNGIHHSENSAERADPKRSPEWELGPIADHD